MRTESSEPRGNLSVRVTEKSTGYKDRVVKTSWGQGLGGTVCCIPWNTGRDVKAENPQLHRLCSPREPCDESGGKGLRGVWLRSSLSGIVYADDQCSWGSVLWSSQVWSHDQPICLDNRFPTEGSGLRRRSEECQSLTIGVNKFIARLSHAVFSVSASDSSAML